MATLFSKQNPWLPCVITRRTGVERGGSGSRVKGGCKHGERMAREEDNLPVRHSIVVKSHLLVVRLRNEPADACMVTRRTHGTESVRRVVVAADPVHSCANRT